MLLLILALSFSVPAPAQPTFPGTPSEPGVNLRVYPSDFWGPRSGPGIGVGLVGYGLTRPHDQWLLTAAPARYEQVGTASFASANPRKARRYVLVDTRALHTDRDWLGPPSQRTVLERRELRARVRVGQAFLQHRLLLQPQVTVAHHRVDAVTPPANRSAPPPAPLPAPGSRHTGLRTGVDLQFDTRDRPVLTTRGVLLQATWTRYLPLDGSAPPFDQVDADAYGYLPLGGRHRLATRLSLTVTRNRASAPIPVYLLPTLGGSVLPGWARGRFAAPDRLLASALYRFPLLHYEALGAIEGHIGVHLASVYNHVGDQFAATVSFEEVVSLGSAARPLRPAASAGLRFAVPFRPYADLELALGVSPDGVTAVRFSLVRSLQSLRFPHHSSDALR